jgi:sulfur-oxidizing protein SoxB
MLFTRRDFLRATAATAILTGAGTVSLGRTAYGQSKALTQDDLLRFEPKGQVTLLHVTDMHAQLKPVYFREPSVNLGVGAVAGEPPHVVGEDFLKLFDIARNTPEAHALTYIDFVDLARQYGRLGGVDRLATLIKAIRAERPDNTLVLDGGDTWQGSYTSYHTKGEDMVKVMNALTTDAMTAHWEFTYGQDRVQELIGKMDFPFLAGNVIDATWEEAVFDSTKMFERGGVKVAVIGQAFPYTPIANPGYMIPDWSFGIRPELVQEHIDTARANGAEVVVLLSHNGFDVDRKLAGMVEGLDVLLSGHTHDALPRAIDVNGTLLVASGSHGKFLSRLDLNVKNGKVADYSYRLIPVFSDVITPDAEMAKLVDDIRAPFAAEIDRVVGTTDALLYRRGNFNGTFDDLICQALLEERDAEIALSPGFRWGATLLPGQEITVDDIHSMTSITYPAAYRSQMTGETLKVILEDVADNIFNEDPFYQQGGDMVRVGGMGYTIDVHKPMGSRISNMTLLKTGEAIEASKEYTVSGWASVNEGTEGPAIWDVVTDYVSKHKTVQLAPNDSIQVRS